MLPHFRLIYSPDFSTIFVSGRLPDFQFPSRSLCIAVFFIVLAFRSPKSVHRVQFIIIAILQGVLSILAILYRTRLPLLMKFPGLDELIEQSETSRSVVQSGNEMIDIILSGKLAEAAAQGIQVKVEEAHAPSKLPLSDVQLSSLLLNIMDNAIHAAGTKGVENPSITLRMRLKTDYSSFPAKTPACPSLKPRKPTRVVLMDGACPSSDASCSSMRTPSPSSSRAIGTRSYSPCL